MDSEKNTSDVPSVYGNAPNKETLSGNPHNSPQPSSSRNIDQSNGSPVLRDAAMKLDEPGDFLKGSATVEEAAKRMVGGKVDGDVTKTVPAENIECSNQENVLSIDKDEAASSNRIFSQVSLSDLNQPGTSTQGVMHLDQYVTPSGTQLHPHATLICNPYTIDFQSYKNLTNNINPESPVLQTTNPETIPFFDQTMNDIFNNLNSNQKSANSNLYREYWSDESFEYEIIYIHDSKKVVNEREEQEEDNIKTKKLKTTDDSKKSKSKKSNSKKSNKKGKKSKRSKLNRDDDTQTIEVADDTQRKDLRDTQTKDGGNSSRDDVDTENTVRGDEAGDRKTEDAGTSKSKKDTDQNQENTIDIPNNPGTSGISQNRNNQNASNNKITNLKISIGSSNEDPIEMEFPMVNFMENEVMEESSSDVLEHSSEIDCMFNFWAKLLDETRTQFNTAKSNWEKKREMAKIKKEKKHTKTTVEDVLPKDEEVVNDNMMDNTEVRNENLIENNDVATPEVLTTDENIMRDETVDQVMSDNDSVTNKNATVNQEDKSLENYILEDKEEEDIDVVGNEVSDEEGMEYKEIENQIQNNESVRDDTFENEAEEYIDVVGNEVSEERMEEEADEYIDVVGNEVVEEEMEDEADEYIDVEVNEYIEEGMENQEMPNQIEEYESVEYNIAQDETVDDLDAMENEVVEEEGMDNEELINEIEEYESVEDNIRQDEAVQDIDIVENEVLEEEEMENVEIENQAVGEEFEGDEFEEDEAMEGQDVVGNEVSEEEEIEDGEIQNQEGREIEEDEAMEDKDIVINDLSEDEGMEAEEVEGQVLEDEVVENNILEDEAVEGIDIVRNEEGVEDAVTENQAEQDESEGDEAMEDQDVVANELLEEEEIYQQIEEDESIEEIVEDEVVEDKNVLKNETLEKDEVLGLSVPKNDDTAEEVIVIDDEDVVSDEDNMLGVTVEGQDNIEKDKNVVQGEDVIEHTPEELEPKTVDEEDTADVIVIDDEDVVSNEDNMLGVTAEGEDNTGKDNDVVEADVVVENNPEVFESKVVKGEDTAEMVMKDDEDIVSNEDNILGVTVEGQGNIEKDKNVMQGEDVVEHTPEELEPKTVTEEDTTEVIVIDDEDVVSNEDNLMEVTAEGEDNTGKDNDVVEADVVVENNPEVLESKVVKGEDTAEMIVKDDEDIVSHEDDMLEVTVEGQDNIEKDKNVMQGEDVVEHTPEELEPKTVAEEDTTEVIVIDDEDEVSNEDNMLGVTPEGEDNTGKDNDVVEADVVVENNPEVLESKVVKGEDTSEMIVKDDEDIVSNEDDMLEVTVEGQDNIEKDKNVMQGEDVIEHTPEELEPQTVEEEDTEEVIVIDDEDEVSNKDMLGVTVVGQDNISKIENVVQTEVLVKRKQEVLGLNEEKEDETVKVKVLKKEHIVSNKDDMLGVTAEGEDNTRMNENVVRAEDVIERKPEVLGLNEVKEDETVNVKVIKKEDVVSNKDDMLGVTAVEEDTTGNIVQTEVVVENKPEVLKPRAVKKKDKTKVKVIKDIDSNKDDTSGVTVMGQDNTGREKNVVQGEVVAQKDKVSKPTIVEKETEDVMTEEEREAYYQEVTDKYMTWVTLLQRGMNIDTLVKNDHLGVDMSPIVNEIFSEVQEGVASTSKQKIKTEPVDTPTDGPSTSFRSRINSFNIIRKLAMSSECKQISLERKKNKNKKLGVNATGDDSQGKRKDVTQDPNIVASCSRNVLNDGVVDNKEEISGVKVKKENITAEDVIVIDDEDEVSNKDMLGVTVVGQDNTEKDKNVVQSGVVVEHKSKVLERQLVKNKGKGKAKVTKDVVSNEDDMLGVKSVGEDNPTKDVVKVVKDETVKGKLIGDKVIKEEVGVEKNNNVNAKVVKGKVPTDVVEGRRNAMEEEENEAVLAHKYLVWVVTLYGGLQLEMIMRRANPDIDVSVIIKKILENIEFSVLPNPTRKLVKKRRNTRPTEGPSTSSRKRNNSSDDSTDSKKRKKNGDNTFVSIGQSSRSCTTATQTSKNTDINKKPDIKIDPDIIVIDSDDEINEAIPRKENIKQEDTQSDYATDQTIKSENLGSTEKIITEQPPTESSDQNLSSPTINQTPRPKIKIIKSEQVNFNLEVIKKIIETSKKRTYPNHESKTYEEYASEIETSSRNSETPKQTPPIKQETDASAEDPSQDIKPDLAQLLNTEPSTSDNTLWHLPKRPRITDSSNDEEKRTKKPFKETSPLKKPNSHST